MQLIIHCSSAINDPSAIIGLSSAWLAMLPDVALAEVKADIEDNPGLSHTFKRLPKHVNGRLANFSNPRTIEKRVHAGTREPKR